MLELHNQHKVEEVDKIWQNKIHGLIDYYSQTEAYHIWSKAKCKTNCASRTNKDNLTV